MKSLSQPTLILLATLLVAVCFACELHTGAMHISVWKGISDALAAHKSLDQLIVCEIRLPRALLALLIGSTLGLSGAALQGLLRNPLAEPGIIGVSNGAALGAVIVFYFGLSNLAWFVLPLGGLAGALVSVLAIFALAGKRASTLTLILAGIAINAIGGALIALALNLAPSPYAMQEIVFWLLGSVANRSMNHVWIALPFMLVGSFMMLSCARFLNALTLGEETATSMGFEVQRERWMLVLGVAAAVGAAVSVSGNIGFVGLVVPHLVRPLVGHEPRRLLLPSALAGAALLLTADIAAQLFAHGGEMKLGVITSLIGGPFFLYLILRTRNGVQP